MLWKLQKGSINAKKEEYDSHSDTKRFANDGYLKKNEQHDDMENLRRTLLKTITLIALWTTNVDNTVSEYSFHLSPH